MKKSTKVIFLIIVIMTTLLIMSFYVNQDIINKMVAVITPMTAIIGAIAIFVQFKKDKDINQANFIVNYGKYFHELKDADEIHSKLEIYQKGEKNIFTENDNIGIIRCLVWCEGLSVLVQDGTLELSKIDNLFSYIFFLIVNNEYIQKLEIIPNAEYYKGIYALHKLWRDYKKNTNQPILNESTDLSKAINYNEICKKGDLFDRKHF